MSEAPEAIWAHKPVIFDDFDIWTEYEVDDATQYTRTDIADARIAEVEAKYSDLGESYEGLSRKYLDAAEKYNAIAMDKIELRGCVADLEGKLAKALDALSALHLQALQSELNNPSHEYGTEALELARATLEALLAEYPKGAG